MDILKAETASRQQNDLVRRMRQAKLPRNCDLDRFDFNHSAGVTKPQLKQLRELVWLDQMYNLIFMGPAGTGKTFMAAGLVRDAVMRCYRAQSLTMDGLINILYVTPLRKAQSSTPISFTSHRFGTDIRWISRSTVSPLRGTPIADNNFRADSEEHFKPCWVTAISQRLVRRRYLNTSSPGCSAKVFFRQSGL